MKLFRNLFDVPSILEQAYNRNEFLVIVAAQANSIVENLCLIKYAKVSELPNYTINNNHWKGELHAACQAIGTMKLKVNNSFEKRLKALKHQFLDKAELDNVDELANRVKDKMKDEHINMDSAFKTSVLVPVANQMERLCAILASYSKEKLYKFVDPEL